MTIHPFMPFFVKKFKSTRTSIVIPDDFYATALAGLEREDVGGSVKGIPAVEVWVALAFVTSDCFCKSVIKDESKKAKDCTHFERKKPVKSVLNHVWLNWKTRGEGVAPSIVVARRELRKDGISSIWIIVLITDLHFDNRKSDNFKNFRKFRLDDSII